MIMHPEHYDVSAANYVGEIDATTVFTGPYDELVDAVTTDGGYAELMHIVAISAALGKCMCLSVSTVIIVNNSPDRGLRISPDLDPDLR